MTTVFRKKFPEKYHIKWFNTMIWGAVLALLVEHIWHGEVVPWPPFLTAMSSPGDTAAMISEMGHIGLPMLIAVFLVWAGMVLIYNHYIAPESKTKTAQTA
ncbi:MAG: hypothetical protein PHT00_01595 [Candidatus Methanomethylophilus sp.]|nr:hypothetical protein [Methanomethylophilus sp.]MDD3232849.1 hypothetical protein [Methanomethylophilus sp.]MDD4668983.1 hypothetical protein [Methanomethylophilus sp.]